TPRSSRSCSAIRTLRRFGCSTRFGDLLASASALERGAPSTSTSPTERFLLRWTSSSEFACNVLMPQLAAMAGPEQGGSDVGTSSYYQPRRDAGASRGPRAARWRTTCRVQRVSHRRVLRRSFRSLLLGGHRWTSRSDRRVRERRFVSEVSLPHQPQAG